MTPARTKEGGVRPVIFSAPMVRAILAGRKTQTRRVLRLPRWASTDPSDIEFGSSGEPEVICQNTGCLAALPMPYAVGDRLWVREAWTHDAADLDALRSAVEDVYADYSYGPYYRATESAPDTMRWRSPIFMPRWASRITLEVTEVRVERLHDISGADAIAEGCKVVRDHCHVFEGTRYDKSGLCHSSAATAFGCFWIETYGADSFEANPWVAAISFVRVPTPLDAAPLPSSAANGEAA